MSTPWNTMGTTGTVDATGPQAAPAGPAGQPQQAWQQAPAPGPFGAPAGPALYGAPQGGFGAQPYGPQQGFTAPGPDGFGGPAYGQQPGFGGQPPQGPGTPGGGFPGGPAPKKNTTMIISLVVAAVLLIGGGVTAFLMLNKNDGPVIAPAAAGSDVNVPTKPSVGVPDSTQGQDDPADDPAEPTKTQPTENEPTKTQPTKTEPTKTEPTDEPAEPTKTEPADEPTGDVGGGDMATAEDLVANWLTFVNEGDVETASQLICQAEQQDFIDGFDGVTTPANQLEAVDMQWDGANIALTLGAVGDTTGSSQLSLTMWPTDTGYFLICSNPLSEADLNW